MADRWNAFVGFGFTPPALPPSRVGRIVYAEGAVLRRVVGWVFHAAPSQPRTGDAPRERGQPGSVGGLR